MKPILKRIACVVCISSLCMVSLTMGSAQTLTPGESASIPLYGIYEPMAAEDTVYSVSVTWGDMEYTYSEGEKGTWDPSTHTYQNGTSSGWNWQDESNIITITNHSNAAVDAIFVGATNGNVTGSFYSQSKGGEALTENELHLDSAVGTTVEQAPTQNVYYQITGGEIQESGTIGNITITLQGAEGSSGKEDQGTTTGTVVTELTLRTLDGSINQSLYSTSTPGVYRTDVLSESYISLNGSVPITFDGQDYYVRGKLDNTYGTVALSTTMDSTSYVRMQDMRFYLEIDLNNWTISTVQA